MNAQEVDALIKRAREVNLTADSLLQLVREHREHCPGESCAVSLSLLRPVYARLISPMLLTPEELALFV